jgi:hypothetical protein
VQHVNVKIFAKTADIDIADAIPIFHRWIQEGVCPELTIDVADYKHVPDGPGIMLIGYEADYSLDEAGGRLGLLYNRKQPVEGDAAAVLKQAYDSALLAAKRLEEEPPFAGKLAFDTGDVEIILNDRLLSPNTIETWNTVEPVVKSFFSKLYGANDFTVERLGEPRERLRVAVKRST